jgi:Zn-dependent peptidase ImmA (M78 family)/DNA-binding XRE family transcriptional regulator
MIALGRESRGMSQTALADALNVTQGRISKMEAGLLPVPGDILIRLCEKLSYPPEFFQRQDQRSGLGPSEFYHYRKRKSIRDKQLEKWHAEFDIRRLNLARLLQGVDIEAPSEFPRFDIDEHDGGAVEIARLVRATWHVPRGPIRNLTKLVEDAGGVIFLHDFGSEHIDGISRYLPPLPPIFFMSCNRNGARFRHSLAHEVAHMVMHRFPNVEMEAQADQFAAEFLTPAAEIRSQLHDVTLAKLASLVPYWRVSLSALLKRACDLDMLPARQQRFLWMQMSRYGYRTKEPAELAFPIEQPTIIRKLVESHRSALNYTRDALAQMVALYPAEFTAIYETQPDRNLRLVRSQK